jgi:chromosome segregation ATPase
MQINIPKFEDIRHEQARRDYENNPYINRVNKLERELAEAKSRSDELKEWGETTIEKLEQERDAYSKRLGEAQAEIARLRNIPRPYKPLAMSAQELQWQHYESLLREQK